MYTVQVRSAVLHILSGRSAYSTIVLLFGFNVNPWVFAVGEQAIPIAGPFVLSSIVRLVGLRIEVVVH